MGSEMCIRDRAGGKLGVIGDFMANGLKFESFLALGHDTRLALSKFHLTGPHTKTCAVPGHDGRQRCHSAVDAIRDPLR